MQYFVVFQDSLIKRKQLFLILMFILEGIFQRILSIVVMQDAIVT